MSGRLDTDLRRPDTLTFGALPAAAAERFGDRVAITYGEHRLTFRDVAASVDRVAKGLLALGVAPGERVAIWLTSCPEWMFAAFAAAKIGAIHVPVNTRFRTADVEYVLRQSGTRTLVTHDVSGPVDYLAMVRELVPVGARSERLPELGRVILQTDRQHPEATSWPALLDAATTVDDRTLAARAAAVRREDTLFILYTSGTTGFPKGVMRTHASVIGNHVDRLRRLRTTERDVFINYLPLFHVFGYVDGLVGPMLAGYRQILMDGFDAEAALDAVEREGGTQLHGFEAHLRALCDAQEARPRNLSTLRTGLWATGAASTTPVAYRALKTLAPLRLQAAYGMTEIGANVSVADFDATDEQMCETSGRACEGLELRIIEPATGSDQPTGVAGEMIVRSAWGMQGYHGMPEETARAVDADGWFHTGDMACLRPDGYVRFIGRYKDMLKVGGENVDPVEVESHLAQLPGIAHVAVVGYPDARLSEVAVAFVVARPGATLTEAAVLAACRGRIASFKIPRHVVFVDDLPMTPSGKVQKVKLREDARRVLGTPRPS